MRNGVVDYFEMSGLISRLDKIIKLRKKYDSKDMIISVDDRISMEFPKHKVCYVCVNGNRAIKYKYGSIGGAVSAAATGATLGMLKGPIRFVTTDKTIANHDFIKETSTLLKNSLEKIERDLQQASKAKWGINTDNIASEQERMSRYDFSSVENEELEKMYREQKKLVAEANSDDTADEVEIWKKYFAILEEMKKRNREELHKEKIPTIKESVQISTVSGINILGRGKRIITIENEVAKPKVNPQITCPNCRATTSTQNGVCEYCGTSLQ